MMKYEKNGIADVLLLVILGVFFGTGCSSETRQSTAELRPSVSETAARFIVRGGQALKRGMYHRTLAMADSAERYAPELADVYFLRARALSEMHRYEDTEKAYEKVISLDPEYQGARFNLGNNAFRQEQFRKALNLYLAERERFPTTDVLVRIAMSYRYLGEADSALAVYREAVTRDSTVAAAYYGMSEIHAERGQLEKALEYSRKAVRLNEDNMQYQYTFGSQLYRAGQIEKAVDSLSAVVEEDPHHREARYDLGQALQDLGRDETADKHLAMADSLRKIDTAIRQAKEDARKKTGDPSSWIELGNLQMQAGRLESSMSSYKIARSLAPGDIQIRTNLATLYMHNGQPEEAIRQYRQVLAQNSALPDVWLNLGIAHAIAGNDEQARQAWKETLRYNPNDAAARKYLAMHSDD
jgi:tetratricopeptide (TPR) repeat protein